MNFETYKVLAERYLDNLGDLEGADWDEAIKSEAAQFVEGH
jgi:hypothetical protein